MANAPKSEIAPAPTQIRAAPPAEPVAAITWAGTTNAAEARMVPMLMKSASPRRNSRRSP